MNYNNNNLSKLYFARYESPNIIIVPTTNTFSQIGYSDPSFARVQNNERLVINNCTVVPDIQDEKPNENVLLNIDFADRTGCVSSLNHLRPHKTVDGVITNPIHSKYIYHNNLVDLTGSRNNNTDKLTCATDMVNLNKDKEIASNNKKIIIQVDNDKDKTSREIDDKMKNLHNSHKNDSGNSCNSNDNHETVSNGDKIPRKNLKRKVETMEERTNTEKKTRLYTINQKLEPISTTNPNNTMDCVISKSSRNTQLDDKPSSAKIKYDTLSEAQIKKLSPGALKRYLDYQRFLRKYLQGTQKKAEQKDIVINNKNDNLKSNKNRPSHSHSVHRKENVVNLEVHNSEKPMKKHVISTTLIKGTNDKEESNKKATNKKPEQMKKTKLNENPPRHLDINKKKREIKEKSECALDLKKIKRDLKEPSVLFSDSKTKKLESNKIMSRQLPHKNKEISKKINDRHLELENKKAETKKALTHYLESKNINKESNRKHTLCSEDTKMKTKSNKISNYCVQQKEKEQPKKAINNCNKDEHKKCDEKSNTFLKSNKKNIKIADKTKSKQDINDTVKPKSTIIKPTKVQTDRFNSTSRAVDVGKNPGTLHMPYKNNEEIDLRTMLIRKKTKNQYCTKSKRFKNSHPEQDNLIITVKQDLMNSKPAKVTHTSCIPKVKKTKKMKLVINIECCSNSDDSDQTKTGCTSPSQDLSFLDDFDVDEIVDSLNIDKTHKSHVTNTKCKKDRDKNFIPTNSFDIKQSDKIIIEDKQARSNNIRVNDKNKNTTSIQVCDDDVYNLIDITKNEKSDKSLIEHQVEDLMKQIFGSSNTEDISKKYLSNKNIKTEAIIVDDASKEGQENAYRKTVPIPKMYDINMQQNITLTAIENLPTGSEPQLIVNKDVVVLKIEDTSQNLIDENTTLPVEREEEKNSNNGEVVLHVKHDKIDTLYNDSNKSENHQAFQNVAILKYDAKSVTLTDKTKLVNNDLNMNSIDLKNQELYVNHGEIQTTGANSIKCDSGQASEAITQFNRDTKSPDDEVVISSTDLTNSDKTKSVYNETNIKCEDLVKSEDNIPTPNLAICKCDAKTTILTNKNVPTGENKKIISIHPMENSGIKSLNNVEDLNKNQDIVAETLSDIEQLQNNPVIINRNPEKSNEIVRVQNIEAANSALIIKIDRENTDSKTKNNVDSDKEVKSQVENCKTLIINDLIITDIKNTIDEKSNSFFVTMEENAFKISKESSTSENIIENDTDNLDKTLNKTSELAEPNIEELSVVDSNDNINLNELVAEKSLEEPTQTTKDVLEDHKTLSSNINNATIIGIEERILQTLKKKVTITALIHRGYYSNIYKYQNEKGETFATKIIRNKIIKSTGYRNKMSLIKKLGPNNSSSILEIINTVYFGNEYFVLTNFYPKNLEEALIENKKCFHIDLVQKLARQLVSAVTVLANNQIIHADIQPNHILLNSTNDQLKLCGFDRSDYSYKIKILPCLGLVNYRAPETILGFFPSCGIDVWSTALITFEMATGIKLFPGQFNNEILFKQLSTLDSFNFDILESCNFASQHFYGMQFMRQYQKGKWLPIPYFKRNNILQNKLFNSYNRDWRNGRKHHQVIKDLDKIDMLYKLLCEMLVMDPRNRIPISFVAVSEFILDIKNSFD